MREYHTRSHHAPDSPLPGKFRLRAEFDQLATHHYPIVVDTSGFEQSSLDLREWLTDNMGQHPQNSRWMSDLDISMAVSMLTGHRWMFHSCVEFRFTSRDDAIMFKLTCGGSV